MPSRFEEASEETPLLTPELAEQVVERFAERRAERERAEAAERERLASMTRIHELADLLGTTPEEIQEIAQAEAKRLPNSPKPVEAVPVVSQDPPTLWMVHAAYLTALAVVAAWGAAQRSSFRVPTPPKPIVVRDHQPRERILMDPSLATPPQGVKLTLIGDASRHTVVGLQGPVTRSKATADALKKAILALVRHEEANFGTIRNWKQASFDSPVRGSVPYPAPGGWHLIEVTIGAEIERLRIPDGRFAERFGAFAKERNAALSDFIAHRFLQSGSQDGSKVKARP